jgi:hypothetical protein
MPIDTAIPFTPTADFFSEETKSHYCKGLGYTARPGEIVAEHVERWVSEGKVTFGAAVAELAGAGEAAEAALDQGLDEVVGVEHQSASTDHQGLPPIVNRQE